MGFGTKVCKENELESERLADAKNPYPYPNLCAVLTLSATCFVGGI